MKSLFSETAKTENHRFYKITQIAYIFGATSHLIVGILFLPIKVYELLWLNFSTSLSIIHKWKKGTFVQNVHKLYMLCTNVPLDVKLARAMIGN